MKIMLRVLCLIGTASLLLACGGQFQIPESNVKIRGGQPVGIFDLAPKSTVSVVSPTAACTGIIIGPRHVLTSSHCLPTESGTTVQLYTGALPNPLLIYQVDRVNMRLGIHPEVDDFVDDTNAFADLAVLRVSGNFSYPYEAAELAPTYPGSAVGGFAVGKGSHEDVPNASHEMRWSNATTASFSDVGGVFGTWGQSTNSGDSGGPLFTISDTSGKLRLIGTLNGGGGVGTVGTDIYTSTAYFRSWILAQMATP